MDSLSPTRRAELEEERTYHDCVMFIDFSHLKLFRGLCSQLREVDSPGQQDRRHFGDAVNLKSVGDAHNLVMVMLLGMLVYIFPFQSEVMLTRY